MISFFSLVPLLHLSFYTIEITSFFLCNKSNYRTKLSNFNGPTSSVAIRLRESDDFDDDFIDRVEGKLNERFPAPKREKTNNKNRAIFSGLKQREGLNRAVAAGLFIAGIGAGIAVDSAINTNPKDLASRDAIDRNAPNPNICI